MSWVLVTAITILAAGLLAYLVSEWLLRRLAGKRDEDSSLR
jgi:hypothetical protein